MVEKKKIKSDISDSSCCGSSQETCCDQSQTSCCNVADLQDCKDVLNNQSTRSMNQELATGKKLKLDIFVPLEACSCAWSQFMNLVFSAITPYIKHVKHETKSLNSEEARELNLKKKCVIIDGEKKYTTSHELKKDLPLILKQRGLL